LGIGGGGGRYREGPSSRNRYAAHANTCSTCQPSNGINGLTSKPAPPTAPQISTYLGAAQLPGALAGAALVIIAACVPRTGALSEADHFAINANIVRTLTEAVAKHSPQVRVVWF